MTKTRINRIGRLGCGALVLSLAAQAAMAQTAYFSIDGDFNNASDEFDFMFDLTRSVDSTETLFFTTYARGGTNEAGDALPVGGIDPTLELFDGANASRGFDDDGSGTFDAYLTWAGLAPGLQIVPLNPDPLLADSYRLNVDRLGLATFGPVPVDLIGPDDAIIFTGGTNTGTATVDSLKFGSNDGGTATYNHSAGTFGLLGELVVAQTGNANLNLTGGNIDTVGLTTVNAGGTVTINGGTLNANGGVLVDGGVLNIPTGTFNLGASQTLTASNNGQVGINDYTIVNGTTFVIDSGASLNALNWVDVGVVSDGTLLVDGATTTFVVGNDSFLGSGGATADVTIRNQASYSAGASTIGIGIGSTANTNGIVRVETGASFSAGEVRVGADGSVGGLAELNLSGVGSSITQNGAANFVIGHASNGSANFIMQGGTFNSGTGVTTINPTGTVNHSGGTYFANGDINVNGGQFLHSGGALSRVANTTLTVQNGGLFEWNDSNLFLNATGSSALVTGAGSVLRQTDSVGNDSTIFIENGVGVDVTLGGKIEAEYLFVTGGSTLNVDGAGSSLEVITGNTPNFNHRIGRSSGTSSLNLTNNATATFDSALPTVMIVGDNAAGTVDVLSGADLTVQTLQISPNTDAAGIGAVTVDGPGSTVTQTGASDLTIGSASGSTGTLNIQNDSFFSTGTGATTINPTGTLNLTGGNFNLNGSLNIDGGQFTRTAGNLLSFGAGPITIQNGGTLNYEDTTLDLELSSTVLVTGPGSLLRNVSAAGDTTLLLGGNIDLDATNQAVVQADYLGLLSGSATFSDATLDVTTGNTPGFGHALGVTGPASLNLTNDSDGSFDSAQPTFLQVGSTQPGSLNVNTGSSLLLQELRIATTGFASGTVTVQGNGSSVTLTNGSALTVGSASGAGAILDVFDDAVFKTTNGITPGNITIDTTGNLNVDSDARLTAKPTPANLMTAGANGSTVVVNGNINVASGGILNLDAGDGGPSLDPVIGGGDGGDGASLTANPGATILVTDGLFTLNGGSGGGAFSATSSGGNAGTGGTLNLTNADLTLQGTAFAQASGGIGGGAPNAIGDGGHGGTFTLNFLATVTQRDDAILRFDGNRGATGGNGGTLHILGGSTYTIEDNALLSFNGGNSTLNVGGFGGDGGLINIADGALTLNGNAAVQLGRGNVAVGSGGTPGVAGTIDVNNLGAFTINNGFVDTGTTRVAGSASIDLNDGTYLTRTLENLNDQFGFNGGSLFVETVLGNLMQDGGTLLPGFSLSTGIITISGNYDLNAGNLEIELRGNGNVGGADFDYIDVTGNANLGGDLVVSAINGFVPTYGDSFEFLSATGTLVDSFSSISLPPAPANAAWSLINTGNSLFLNLDSTLVGDLNNDGFVGIDDLNIVLGAWNQNVPPGNPLADPSGDGFVGIDDLNTVLGNWNAGTPPPPINTQANIPEPGVLMMIGIGGMGLLSRRVRS